MHRSLLAGAAVGTLIAGLAVVWLSHNTAPTRTTDHRAALSCSRPAGGGRPATLRVSAIDTKLPEALEDALKRGTAMAQARWQDWLGNDRLAGSPVDLLFIADAQRFAQLYNGPDVDGWTTTGFYRIRSHEAVILWAEPWRTQAFATALHEVSHLLTAWHLGPTPPWLNEGLAEHFETLDHQADAFRVSAAHLRTLHSKGPVNLDTLLGLSARTFARDDAERNYASAWALVAFLLDSESGRATFLGLLSAAHTRRCAPVSDVTPLLSRYPGGLEALRTDWLRWIAEQSPA